MPTNTPNTPAVDAAAMPYPAAPVPNARRCRETPRASNPAGRGKEEDAEEEEGEDKGEEDEEEEEEEEFGPDNVFNAPVFVRRNKGVVWCGVVWGLWVRGVGRKKATRINRGGGAAALSAHKKKQAGA